MLLFQCGDDRASAPAAGQLEHSLPGSELSSHSTVVAEKEVKQRGAQTEQELQLGGKTKERIGGTCEAGRGLQVLLPCHN